MAASPLVAMQLAQQQAQAQQARAALLTGFGDPQLANMLLGPTYGNIAAANPFSTTAEIDYQAGEDRNTLEEQLSRNNLWYSSARGDQLSKLGRSVLGRKAAAAGQVQSSLAQIAQQLWQAQMQAQADALAEKAARTGPTGDSGGGIAGQYVSTPLSRELYPEMFQTGLSAGSQALIAQHNRRNR